MEEPSYHHYYIVKRGLFSLRLVLICFQYRDFVEVGSLPVTLFFVGLRGKARRVLFQQSKESAMFHILYPAFVHEF